MTPQATDFGRLVLVCADCEKRDHGPAHLESKPVARELRHALADGRPRAKVVRTRCMGLCPRKALACMSGGATTEAVELRDHADVRAWTAHLLATA